MVTSRTGTAVHKQFRTRVLQRDRDNGIVTCPLCGVALDYSKGRQPNSAEPDHIIPIALGGNNDPDNGRTICRQCNQSRGKRMYTPTEPPKPRVVTNRVHW